MPLYEFTSDEIRSIEPTTFEKQAVRERLDLQRLLCRQIDILDPNLFVITDEFDQWDDSRRRIDILCVEPTGRLVVIELKRTESGGHMELQAIRYAAMVARMTLEEASIVHARYSNQTSQAALESIIDHLSESESPEEDFASDVAIILVAADFGKEITTTSLWLNEHSLDIRCIRLSPWMLDGRLLLHVEQIIPLPVSTEYQIRIRHKEAERRRSASGERWGGFWLINVGEDRRSCRSWDESRKYGYISAGGGPKWQREIQKPQPGEYVLAYLNTYGYVGFGRVLSPAVPVAEFRPPGNGNLLIDIESDLWSDSRDPTAVTNPEKCEYCLAIDWISTCDRESAVRQDLFRRGTAVRMRKQEDVHAILAAFGIDSDKYIEE